MTLEVVVGDRGPVPKRSDQRRRRNEPVRAVTKIPGAAVRVPELGFDVAPVVADWYRSLGEGPEARFYTAAMWQRARLVALVLSDWLGSEKRSAVMWSALQDDMKSLLVDAGELRRLGIEVQPAEPEARGAVIDWRARASAGA